MEARDNPSTPSGAWNRMSPVRDMITAILAGPAAIRAAKTIYLPKHAAEAQPEYDRRVSQAPWAPELEDILRSLASKPFGKEISLVEASPRIKELAEDIDGRGNNLTAFARPVFEGAIAQGCHAVLVDNTGRGQARTVAEERQAGVRPYWVSLRAEDIIDLKTAFVGGAEQVYHVRIRESATTLDGYTEVIKERIRELNREPAFGPKGDIVSLGPPSWKLHEARRAATSSDVEWVQIDDGAFAPVKEIPLALLWTGKREGPQFVRSPIGALADKQIELYRAMSRKDEVYTKAGFPMLTGNGLGPPAAGTPIETGPGRILYAPGQGSSWGYIAPDAEVLKAVTADVEATRDDLRRLGMQPLTQKTGGVTATASAIEGAKAHSAVEAWALGLKDMIEHALAFTAQWLGESDAAEVDVDTDFSVEPYAQAPLDALGKARQARDISQRTYWSGLRRFDVLSPDFDPDAEEKALATETEGLEPEPPEPDLQEPAAASA